MESRNKPTADNVAAVLQERIFHCTTGAAHKFWSVSVEVCGAGAVQTVRFGRIGTPGQTQNKSFVCAADATIAALHLIAAKRKKGYVEVTQQTAAHTPARKLPPRKGVEHQLALPF
jgi:predicted DNA-binding WGR domain protein